MKNVCATPWAVLPEATIPATSDMPDRYAGNLGRIRHDEGHVVPDWTHADMVFACAS